MADNARPLVRSAESVDSRIRVIQPRLEGAVACLLEQDRSCRHGVRIEKRRVGEIESCICRFGDGRPCLSAGMARHADVRLSEVVVDYPVIDFFGGLGGEVVIADRSSGVEDIGVHVILHLPIDECFGMADVTGERLGRLVSGAPHRRDVAEARVQVLQVAGRRVAPHAILNIGAVGIVDPGLAETLPVVFRLITHRVAKDVAVPRCRPRQPLLFHVRVFGFEGEVVGLGQVAVAAERARGDV